MVNGKGLECGSVAKLPWVQSPEHLLQKHLKKKAHERLPASASGVPGTTGVRQRTWNPGACVYRRCVNPAFCRTRCPVSHCRHVVVTWPLPATALPECLLLQFLEVLLHGASVITCTWPPFPGSSLELAYVSWGLLVSGCGRAPSSFLTVA